MPSLNPLTTLQIVLITVGVVFQFAAFSAFRKASQGRGRAAGAEHELEPQELPRPESPKSRPSALRWKESRDYYEMEQTPAGIRPGELLKTAKVRYFDAAKLPPE